MRSFAETRNCAQKSANASPQKSAKERKRPQKSAKERFHVKIATNQVFETTRFGNCQIHSLRIYPYPMVLPLSRPWSETMVSILLWAQKTLEIKGFLGLQRPFLDLVSQTPRPTGRGRPLFADKSVLLSLSCATGSATAQRKTKRRGETQGRGKHTIKPLPKNGFGPPHLWYDFPPPFVHAMSFSLEETVTDQTNPTFWGLQNWVWRGHFIVRSPPPKLHDTISPPPPFCEFPIVILRNWVCDSWVYQLFRSIQLAGYFSTKFLRFPRLTAPIFDIHSGNARWCPLMPVNTG